MNIWDPGIQWKMCLNTVEQGYNIIILKFGSDFLEFLY